MAMPCVRGARWPQRTCVVAQRLRWRGVALQRGGEAIRAVGEAARAATLLTSGRGMCVSRGRANHRRRTRPAERRTAASITSVRDHVREPGRAGRGVIEEAEAYVVVVLESLLEFCYILRRLSPEAARRMLPKLKKTAFVAGAERRAESACGWDGVATHGHSTILIIITRIGIETILPLSLLFCGRVPVSGLY
jgi:hypothetical protein